MVLKSVAGGGVCTSARAGLEVCLQIDAQQKGAGPASLRAPQHSQITEAALLSPLPQQGLM